MTTLITDEFGDDLEHNYEPHNIVYGCKGWTDVLSDQTITMLLSVGAIVLSHVIDGVGFQTRIYVSARGTEPK